MPLQTKLKVKLNFTFTSKIPIKFTTPLFCYIPLIMHFQINLH